MINTYQLTPLYRVAVDYDCGPQDPPSHLLDTVFYEVASCQNLDIHEGTPAVIAALEGVEGAVNDYDYDSADSVAAALIKHLERHGYKAVYRTFAGVCPSDWCDAVAAVRTSEGVALDAAVSDWERWFDNDYYVITLQRRHVWHDAAGDTLETWDDVDALYGVALDDAYNCDEVARAARYYFDVEEAA
jgi:hypothetical protein|nr:MAG TPA: hypothetical protein [Caudoviricetes sp.]